MEKNIVESIKNAIENKELHAYYQPQFDAITGRIISAEALVRWIKREGEVVPPFFFVPELEKTNAINDVDWFMLEEACKTISKQIAQGTAVPISVNFSRWHVTEDTFEDKLNRIVDGYNIPHNLIEIEITE